MSIFQAFFILSGESEFTEKGVEHDFLQFYETRIQILKKGAHKNSKHYWDLIVYFNENLFSDAPMDDMIIVDEEEAQLLNALSDEDEDEDEEPDHAMAFGNLEYGGVGGLEE